LAGEVQSTQNKQLKKRAKVGFLQRVFITKNYIKNSDKKQKTGSNTHKNKTAVSSIIRLHYFDAGSEEAVSL
jgi:hypothetical protein